MKKIELTIDNINFDGLTAISIVKDAAIEENFYMFSNEKKIWNFSKVDNDKRIITGPALIPNRDIYRINEKGEEYNVFFSEETVRILGEKFMRENKNHNITLEHMVNANDIYVFENWFIENPEMDKSKHLGYENLNKSTWMISMKVENEDVWNNFIKSGAIKGFSIEGYFTEKLINFSTIEIETGVENDEPMLSEEDILLNEILKILDEYK
jgi:hypothetical protein